VTTSLSAVMQLELLKVIAIYTFEELISVITGVCSSDRQADSNRHPILPMGLDTVG
jgi:hypothetical protein